MSNKLNGSDEEVKLSDIEVKLIEDESGQFRDHLMNQLFEQMVKLKTIRQATHLPDEFEHIEAMLLATAAAGETVANVWKRHHQKSLQTNN